MLLRRLAMDLLQRARYEDVHRAGLQVLHVARGEVRQKKNRVRTTLRDPP